jgi:hypothetical protein
VLIWRGFGAAVPLLTFAALLFTELGVERAFSDDAYYQEHGWPKFLGFAVAAVAVWLLSKRLEQRPARIVIDRETGEEIRLEEKHDLFYVPLRYWPSILILAGLGFLMFG